MEVNGTLPNRPHIKVRCDEGMVALLYITCPRCAKVGGVILKTKDIAAWAGCWHERETFQDRLHLLKGMNEFSGYLNKGDVLVRSSKGRLFVMRPEMFNEFLEVYELPQISDARA